MHGADKGQPLQGPDISQSIAVVMSYNISYCLCKTHGKEPVSVVLITFYGRFAVTECQQRRLLGKGLVYQRGTIDIGYSGEFSARFTNRCDAFLTASS